MQREHDQQRPEHVDKVDVHASRRARSAVRQLGRSPLAKATKGRRARHAAYRGQSVGARSGVVQQVRRSGESAPSVAELTGDACIPRMPGADTGSARTLPEVERERMCVLRARRA